MKTILDVEARRRILDRIHAISPDDVPRWGRMNASQMLCHTADQIRIARGAHPCAFVGNFMLVHVVKRLVLWGMPLPKGKVETVKELKQGKGGTPPADFESDRSALVAAIGAFVDDQPDEALVEHPAFGRMDKKEWGRLIHIHLDHHLTQFGH